MTIDDVEHHYQLVSIRIGGHRVNVCKISTSFLTSVRQCLTAYLNAECVQRLQHDAYTSFSGKTTVCFQLTECGFPCVYRS